MVGNVCMPLLRINLIVLLTALSILYLTSSAAALPRGTSRTVHDALFNCLDHSHRPVRGTQFSGSMTTARNPRMVRTFGGKLQRKSAKAMQVFGRMTTAVTKRMTRAEAASRPIAQASGPATSVPAPTLILGSGGSNAFNLYVFGDGFTSAQQPAFNSYLSAQMNAVFNREPLKSYKSYFNVYRYNLISTQSGIPSGAAGNTPLGMYLGCSGVQRAICINANRAWEIGRSHGNPDAILAIANTTQWGGSAYLNSAIATMTMLEGVVGTDVLLHELFGHAVGWNLDEYATNPGTYSGPLLEQAFPNVSSNPAEVLLRGGLGPTQLFGQTDRFLNQRIWTYEGAAQYARGAYRYTPDSLMRTIGSVFSQVNAFAVVQGIYNSRLFSSSNLTMIDSSSHPEWATVSPDTTISIQIKRPTHGLKVQWYDGSTPIAGATGTSIVPSRLGLAAGQRMLQVEVWDPSPFWIHPEATMRQAVRDSRSWRVTIAGAPSGDTAPRIVAQPGSLNVVEGSAVTFSVRAEGAAPLSYRWTEQIGAITRTVGGDSANLSFSAAMTQNGARYSVAVSNRLGSLTSTAATLTVRAGPPRITQDLPASITVDTGASLTLQVGASGSGLSFSWLKNGAVLAGRTTATLSIPSTVSGDAGRYLCRISNASGTVNSTTTEVIVRPPAQLAPQVLGPTGSFQLTDPIVVRWSTSIGALSYRIFIRNAAGQVAFSQDGVAGSQFQLPAAALANLIVGQSYVAKVGANFPLGVYRESTAGAQFTISGRGSAGNGGTVVAGFVPTGPVLPVDYGRLTFSWPAIAGAARYELILTNSLGHLGNGWRVSTPTNYVTPQITIIGQMYANQIVYYTWSVQAFNSAGAVIGSHAAVSFRTEIPRATPSFPIGNVARSSLTRWQFSTVAGATGYRIHLWDLSTGAVIWYDYQAGALPQPYNYVAGRRYRWAVAARVAGALGPQTTAEFTPQ